MSAPPLFLVTDPGYGSAHVESVVSRLAQGLPQGSFAVQLRDKRRERDERRELGARLRGLTRTCGAMLVVNGDLALAMEIHADGIHLGRGAPPVADARRACPGAWVSMAAHSDADVQGAVAAAADAVMVSPIFETPGKGPPRGVEAIERARSTAGGALAVYALGGISAERVGACRAAGASGVAVVRAVLGVPDPVAAARHILAGLY